MSVLKNKRTESKAEYINKANAIYLNTLSFITRLSNRYSRLIAQDIIHLASEVLDNCEKANSIFPSDDQREHRHHPPADRPGCCRTNPPGKQNRKTARGRQEQQTRRPYHL